MPNVIVSIGRNIKNEPMSNTDWHMFKSQTRNVVYKYCPDIYFTGEGKGYYEGQSEDSFTIIGGLEYSRTGLKRELADLATQFNQESIAMTVADPEFVPAA